MSKKLRKKQRRRLRQKERKELRRKVAYWHTKKRCRQRYGIYLSREDYDDAIRRIQDGQARFLGAQSLARRVVEIRIQDEPVVVVYNRKHKLIHTAIPAEGEY